MTDANTRSDTRSAVLPTDPFDIALGSLIGLPDGANTKPAVVQSIDPYGNTTTFTVQSVRWAEGLTVFVTLGNADGFKRFVLPPKVTATIVRQLDQLSTMLRVRQGQRLAETQAASGRRPTFTPEMRAKAAATRRQKAERRQARRAKKGGAR